MGSEPKEFRSPGAANNRAVGQILMIQFNKPWVRVGPFPHLMTASLLRDWNPSAYQEACKVSQLQPNLSIIRVEKEEQRVDTKTSTNYSPPWRTDEIGDTVRSDIGSLSLIQGNCETEIERTTGNFEVCRTIERTLDVITEEVEECEAKCHEATTDVNDTAQLKRDHVSTEGFLEEVEKAEAIERNKEENESFGEEENNEEETWETTEIEKFVAELCDEVMSISSTTTNVETEQMGDNASKNNETEAWINEYGKIDKFSEIEELMHQDVAVKSQKCSGCSEDEHTEYLSINSAREPCAISNNSDFNFEIEGIKNETMEMEGCASNYMVSELKISPSASEKNAHDDIYLESKIHGMNLIEKENGLLLCETNYPWLTEYTLGNSARPEEKGMDIMSQLTFKDTIIAHKYSNDPFVVITESSEKNSSGSDGIEELNIRTDDEELYGAVGFSKHLREYYAQQTEIEAPSHGSHSDHHILNTQERLSSKKHENENEIENDNVNISCNYFENTLMTILEETSEFLEDSAREEVEETEYLSHEASFETEIQEELSTSKHFPSLSSLAEFMPDDPFDVDVDLSPSYQCVSDADDDLDEYFWQTLSDMDIFRNKTNNGMQRELNDGKQTLETCQVIKKSIFSGIELENDITSPDQLHQRVGGVVSDATKATNATEQGNNLYTLNFESEPSSSPQLSHGETDQIEEEMLVNVDDKEFKIGLIDDTDKGNVNDRKREDLSTNKRNEGDTYRSVHSAELMLDLNDKLAESMRECLSDEGVDPQEWSKLITYLDLKGLREDDVIEKLRNILSGRRECDTQQESNDITEGASFDIAMQTTEITREDSTAHENERDKVFGENLVVKEGDDDRLELTINYLHAGGGGDNAITKPGVVLQETQMTISVPSSNTPWDEMNRLFIDYGEDTLNETGDHYMFGGGDGTSDQKYVLEQFLREKADLSTEITKPRFVNDIKLKYGEVNVLADDSCSDQKVIDLTYELGKVTQNPEKMAMPNVALVDDYWSEYERDSLIPLNESIETVEILQNLDSLKKDNKDLHLNEEASSTTDELKVTDTTSEAPRSSNLTPTKEIENKIEAKNSKRAKMELESRKRPPLTRTPVAKAHTANKQGSNLIPTNTSALESKRKISLSPFVTWKPISKSIEKREPSTKMDDAHVGIGKNQGKNVVNDDKIGATMKDKSNDITKLIKKPCRERAENNLTAEEISNIAGKWEEAMFPEHKLEELTGLEPIKCKTQNIKSSEKNSGNITKVSVKRVNHKLKFKDNSKQSDLEADEMTNVATEEKISNIAKKWEEAMFPEHKLEELTGLEPIKCKTQNIKSSEKNSGNITKVSVKRVNHKLKFKDNSKQSDLEADEMTNVATEENISNIAKKWEEVVLPENKLEELTGLDPIKQKPQNTKSSEKNLGNKINVSVKRVKHVTKLKFKDDAKQPDLKEDEKTSQFTPKKLTITKTGGLARSENVLKRDIDIVDGCREDASSLMHLSNKSDNISVIKDAGKDEAVEVQTDLECKEIKKLEEVKLSDYALEPLKTFTEKTPVNTPLAASRENRGKTSKTPVQKRWQL